MATMIDLPTPSPGGLSEPLQLLTQARVALAAQIPTDLPGPQALLETEVLLVELDRLKAVALARVADVDRRGLAELDGARSTAAWVAQQETGMDRSEVTLARRLDRFPRVAEHVFEGWSLAAAQRVAAALTRLRPHVDRVDGLLDGQPADEVLTAVIGQGVLSVICEAKGGLADDDPRVQALQQQLATIATRPASGLERLEEAFLVLAAQVESVFLPGALERLVDALLPAQLQDASDRASRDRELFLTRSYGGGWTVRGQLDDECGELLSAVLTAGLATDEDGPADTAAWASQREAGAEAEDVIELDGCQGAPRSMRQRRHDALRTVLRTLLDSGGLGSRGKAAPHIAVTVGLEALHGAPGALPAVGGSGKPLAAGLVRSWLCDSALTRFVLGIGRRVVETSHTERTLKAHERRIKLVETGGRCQGAGCARSPDTVLIPHHVTPWAQGHTTSVDDTVMVCPLTHHDVHDGRVIRLQDGRYLDANGWRDGP